MINRNIYWDKYKKYFFISGDPEFCLDKPPMFYEVPATISFTVCGAPSLSVLWKYETSRDAELIVGKPFANTSYAYIYFLNITNGMCGRKLHFVAVNYNGKSLAWNPVMKFICK